MNIQSTGLSAYGNAMADFAKTQKSLSTTHSNGMQPAMGPGIRENSFADTLKESLTKVNDMQTEKSAMVKSFASGETQNVHELMITLQKAGLAINMTTAVRNKVLEAYRELSRLQF